MARYCAYCGQPLSEGAKFCGFCGGPVPDAEPTPRQDPFAQNPQPEPESPETPEAPEQPAAFKEQYRDGANSWQDSPKPKRKQRKTLGLIALVCGATVALLLVGGFLWPGFFRSAGRFFHVLRIASFYMQNPHPALLKNFSETAEFFLPGEL